MHELISNMLINICCIFFIFKVANLAVIMYFIAALFSRQFLIPDQDAHGSFPNSTIVYSPKPPFNKHTPHMYFPLFTIVEIICYMGWVKVAGSLLNPFGGILRQFWNVWSNVNMLKSVEAILCSLNTLLLLFQTTPMILISTTWLTVTYR